jgi:light-regulated signal transduction histidine kinase (bacteriophytochrome)
MVLTNSVNLLSKAIKFSRTNEIPKVFAGASVKGEEALYFVKDDGTGFDMKYVDKLFGVFQRLHSVNEFEDTGRYRQAHRHPSRRAGFGRRARSMRGRILLHTAAFRHNLI